MSKAQFAKINEVEGFMMDLHCQDRSLGHHGIPYDSMGYGVALVHWHERGCPGNAYFSTDDPAMLECAMQLRTQFGLEIVTHAEGIARERSLKTERKVVTGFEWGDKWN